MAEDKAKGGVAGGLVIIVIAFLIVLGGVIWYLLFQISTSDLQNLNASVDDEVTIPINPDAELAPKSPAQTPPTFDTVRIEADGTSVIAGRFEGIGFVDILLDGTKIHRTETASDGSFAAFFSIEPSSEPRSISLMAVSEGQNIVSDETLIIAPTLPPETVSNSKVASILEPTDLETTEDKAEPIEFTETLAEKTPVEEVENMRESMNDISEDTSEDLALREAVEELPSSIEPTFEKELSFDTSEQTISELDKNESVNLTEVESQVIAPIISEQKNEKSPLPTQAEIVGEAEAKHEDQEAPELAKTAQAPEPKREQEIISPQILIADKEGVRVLQSSSDTSPEVMANLSLDTISYKPSGDVVLAGRATTDGFVRVYLNNRPVMEGAIDDSLDWNVILTGINAGIYTLRVDQIGDDGTVVSRIETPFLREEIETVAATLADDVEKDDFVIAQRTVEQGNTLWAIAREKYGEGVLYVHVYNANKDQIRDPDLIYPGQIFILPELNDIKRN